MSTNLASAMLVSVPKFANGDAGAGFCKTCVRSLAVSMVRSAEKVAEIVT